MKGLAVAEDVEPFSHAWVSLGELGKGLKMLKDAGVTELTLAGKMARPEWSAIKLDARGALALPGVIAAALKGDDALLRSLMGIFEKEGFRVMGAAEAAPDLLVPKGRSAVMRRRQRNRTTLRSACARRARWVRSTSGRRPPCATGWCSLSKRPREPTRCSPASPIFPSPCAARPRRVAACW